MQIKVTLAILTAISGSMFFTQNTSANDMSSAGNRVGVASQQPLRERNLEALVVQDVTHMHAQAASDAELTNFHVMRQETRDGTYSVLATYHMGNTPYGVLSLVRKDARRGWAVIGSSCAPLDVHRGFEIYAMYDQQAQSFLLASLIHNPNIVALRIRDTNDAGASQTAQVVPVDSHRQVFTSVRDLTGLQIDGLNKEGQVLYGWG